MSLPQIQEIILHVLYQHNGCFAGTLNLAEQIPASQKGVIKSLRQCQHSHLIKSIHSHGGRGHKSIHRLTAKGKKYVDQSE